MRFRPALRGLSMATSYGQSRAPLIVHHMIEAATAAAPAVAAVVGDQTLSYGELLTRAQSLASSLREAGVTRGSLVGVFAESSPHLVVAALGVLEAEAAYVPLDPGYPPDRLTSMLQRARVSAFVAQEGYLPLAGDHAEAPTFELALGPVAKASPPTASDDVSPADAAYVMFTSGSTGTPKGVMISHKALARHIHAQQQEFGLSSHDRVLQFFSPSFDGSAEEIFPTLASGATLVLRTERMVESVEGFWSECDRLGVSIAHLPTSFWHELAVGGGTVPGALRLIVVGGELIRLDLLARWRRRVAERVRLIDVYGATEATIMSTAMDWTTAPIPSPTSEIAVGSALGEDEVLVVDERYRRVPDGAPGEIAIAGPGVAHGYLGDVRTTATRFVPDERRTGTRMYLTGDRGRMVGDLLFFAGRSDEQLKLRGFRIEPADVETAMEAHPAVSACAVVAAADALTAFVVMTDETEEAELRVHAQAKLPPFMVPARIIRIDALPLTPNAKVDRRRLTAEAVDLASSEDEAQWPADPLERDLVAIWREVLGVPRVGADDDLFDFGLHSLQLLRVQSRIRESLGLDVETRDLFETRTVRRLAARIDANGIRRLAETIPRSELTRAPLTRAQLRLWLLEQVNPAGALAYTIPFARRIQGPLNVAVLGEAFENVVARHAALRTSFRFEGEEGVQQIHDDIEVPFDMVELSSLAGDERAIEAVCSKYSEHTFDLTHPPLIRAWLLRLASDDHILLVVVHHIVFDGWSIEIFDEELGREYRSLAHGEDAPRDPSPPRFLDFAIWDRARSEDSDAHLEHWVELLDGADRSLRLPFDRQHQRIASFRGGREFRQLGAEPTLALSHAAMDAGTTAFAMMAAAIAACVSAWTSQREFVIGSSLAARPLSALERVIGLFVDTTVLRYAIDPAAEFSQLARATHDQVIEAYQRQLPLEAVLRTMGLGGALSHQPLFEVVIGYHRGRRANLELGGDLQVDPQQVDNRSAKFDLMLDIDHEDGALHIALEFNGDVFERGTARRLLDDYIAALKVVLNVPGATVGSVISSVRTR